MKKVIVGCLLLFQVAAYAKIYGPKRYDFRGLVGFVGADVYQASERFDNNANAKGLPYSGTYLLADFPFGFRYVLLGNIGLEAELKASYAVSESKAPVYGGSRTQSQLNEMRISADYLIQTDMFDIIPEFEAIFPFTKVNPQDDDVLLSEGVQSLIGRVHLQTEFGASEVFANIGYQNRDKGRSQLVPWSVGLGWNPGKLFFGGRVFGFQSVSDDDEENIRIFRESYIDKVNAGAPRFYGVTPSVVSAEGIVSFRASPKWTLQFNAGLDIAGENYSKGIFGGANLILDFGLQERNPHRRVRRKREEAPQPSGIAIDPYDNKFREEIISDPKDQEYFQPPPAPRKRPRVKKPAVPSQRQLQDQLDDVEMQIELKKKRRR